jgi:hypothetical protein
MFPPHFLPDKTSGLTCCLQASLLIIKELQLLAFVVFKHMILVISDNDVLCHYALHYASHWSVDVPNEKSSI